jgi:hypothetical protein
MFDTFLVKLVAALNIHEIISTGATTVHVGIAAAVATLAGYTSGLLYGFSLRVYLTGLLYGFYTRFLYSGNLFGTIVLIFCLYIWGQLPFKLIIKQLKQFNLFYATHISLLLL